jgi:hypothetical protein
VREQWDFPFEREAGQNLPLPEGLSLADRMAYSALRNIYRAFHAGDIGRDRAGEEKQRLRRAWEQARESEAFERKLCAYHTRLIGAMERAVCRCRKEPTAENALYLCDVLDGIERPEVDESGRSGQV